jgi:hypothetical protein
MQEQASPRVDRERQEGGTVDREREGEGEGEKFLVVKGTTIQEEKQQRAPHGQVERGPGQRGRYQEAGGRVLTRRRSPWEARGRSQKDK